MEYVFLEIWYFYLQIFEEWEQWEMYNFAYRSWNYSNINEIEITIDIIDM